MDIKMSNSVSILVVDDRLSMAESLRDVLELKDFIAYSACSGKEALEILREHPVDVMLTDVIMPGMNGLELYRETKKTYPTITTIFMTAYAADALIEQGMAEGIRIVLSKPLDINFLLVLVAAKKKIISENSSKDS
jgi:CheY-like chemotaxis protein